MSSRDIFIETQETSIMKAPHTPNLTPSRSLRRRSSVMSRPKETSTMSGMSIQALKKGGSCISASQPVLCEDFYHLRTRQVPISKSMGEIWAQYGIRTSYDSELNTTKEGQSHMKSEKELRTWLSKSISFLGLLVFMVLSAFLGALIFANFQHYFYSHQGCDDHCSSHLQLTQNVPEFRLSEETLQLQNTILKLADEMNNLKDNLNRIQENVGSKIIARPQKGILEELLTADLACAGNMGSVLATPDTTTYTVHATVTFLWFFPFQVEMKHRTPQTTIEGLIQEVGDCWPFEGSRGRLVLKLHRPSLVTGVSISHIPSSVSVAGDVTSAPRHFQILVHKNEYDLENGHIFGEFEYKNYGSWRQMFPLDPFITKEALVRIIEFRFLKNYGHPNYTCVYRVHVHGKPVEVG